MKANGKDWGWNEMSSKALLVGINDYYPRGPGGPDLEGCVNDVRDMINTLFIFNFRKMKVLTNSRATRDEILKGLRWLTAEAKKGDTLVFYYSGHGSRVPDMDGDEPDRKDEILCPHDMSFEKGIYISDDNLRDIFSDLPEGVNLEVIIDACHSGTITRDLPGEDLAATKPRVRYLEPPLDMGFYLDYWPELPSRGLLRPDATREVAIAPGLNHVLWSACRHNQTAQEIEMERLVRGAFTYHFCKALRRSDGKVSRMELDSLIGVAMKRFNQIPQLEASNKELMDQPFR